MTKLYPMNTAWQSSFFTASNSLYLESLYETFLKDPQAIPEEWRNVFQQLPAVSSEPEAFHSEIRDYFLKLARQVPKKAQAVDSEHEKKQIKVLQLINAYRFRGHQRADIDPLKLRVKRELPELSLAYHQLSEKDLDIVFNTGSFLGSTDLPLRDILTAAENTYCRTIGLEYMHMTETKEKRWVQNRFEPSRSKPTFNIETKKQLLADLIAAEGLEKYLHSKYVGQKRFSLEGGESLIPIIHDLIERAGSLGMKEIVIGMAHRGRLNVLINTLGKSPSLLFKEFEGKYENIRENASGDVKYHLGFSSDLRTSGGDVHIALAFNPSHLEIVSPVVAGSVRARQERRHDAEKNQVMAITLHGDASFAGQGVIMETLNMSQARGFSIGGTIHIIINNQIGFTTSNPMDARSTLHCTDVAKMVQAPIFHVNGDDPEAVLFVTQAALDYRMTFKKDVIIDLVCYRRHGHNEADEPAATQPVMYQRIKSQPTTATLYGQQLIEEGVIAKTDFEQMMKDYRAALEAGKSVVKGYLETTDYPFSQDWLPFMGQTSPDFVTDTQVKKETLQTLARRLETLPEQFVLNPRVKKIMDDRHKMAEGNAPIDWGYAETLAYATLLNEGYPVRLVGQDTGRGTFFHRHAILHHQETGEHYIPLQHIDAKQPNFLVIDSLLSEEAVLAFEYGYSTTDPKTLVIWEAQYGDFANGAQVVVDQFISSGEQKWGRLCGLVMFLPHGYEGQGPEHSSARLERYLQLCAQHNMQICVPSTPAQAFHMLRRQMKSRTRLPLVVMTPKSLLRHKLATSALQELEQGLFQPVISEVDVLQAEKVTRVLLCSGKVYYDLLEARREQQKNHIAIIRIEQLYPFPETQLKTELNRYPNATEIIWCQEEPKNQGAWYGSQHHLRRCLESNQTLEYVGRPDSASPAVGYNKIHVQQEQAIIEEALRS